MKCFEIELVLCDLYLTKFDLTKCFLLDTLFTLSIRIRIIYTTNDLVDRIRYLKSKASLNDCEEDVFSKHLLKKMFGE